MRVRLSSDDLEQNHLTILPITVYVPKTRSDLSIPKEGPTPINYDEYFEDTPLFTLYMLIRQQLLAFPAYLCESTRHFLRSGA